MVEWHTCRDRSVCVDTGVQNSKKSKNCAVAIIQYDIGAVPVDNKGQTWHCVYSVHVNELDTTEIMDALVMKHTPIHNHDCEVHKQTCLEEQMSCCK